MEYTPFLEYTRKFLQNLKVNLYVIEPPYEWIDEYDGGFCKKTTADYAEFSQRFSIFLKETAIERKILIVTTSMEYTYIIAKLPNCYDVLISSPFSFELISDERCIEICNMNDVPASLNDFMQMYYSSLPYIADDNTINSIMRCLGEKFWGEDGFEIVTTRLYGDLIEYNEDLYAEPTTDMLMALEKRYETEKHLMEAIRHGDYEAMKQVIANPVPLKPRFPDSIRDLKNLLIVLNTICRKAAELGLVHPIYLDDLSRKFAIRIENTTTISQLNDMRKEMLRKYCAMVRSHSLKNYSQPIQNVINYICIYMREDLSLKAVAQKFSLSSSYLSTLFKKETGMTLTNYVNEKKIEHAIYLLNISTRPVQEIASLCGIDDVNYFSRLFKKLKHMTPSQYRTLIANQKRSKT